MFLQRQDWASVGQNCSSLWAKSIEGSTVNHGLIFIFLITTLHRGKVGMKAQHACVQAN